VISERRVLLEMSSMARVVYEEGGILLLLVFGVYEVLRGRREEGEGERERLREGGRRWWRLWGRSAISLRTVYVEIGGMRCLPLQV
jgi:hypothetical protein